MGLNIRKLRERHRMSQEQLAADAEIPYSTVNEIEAGKTNPTVATLMALADALDLPITELLNYQRF